MPRICMPGAREIVSRPFAAAFCSAPAARIYICECASSSSTSCGRRKNEREKKPPRRPARRSSPLKDLFYANVRERADFFFLSFVVYTDDSRRSMCVCV